MMSVCIGIGLFQRFFSSESPRPKPDFTAIESEKLTKKNPFIAIENWTQRGYHLYNMRRTFLEQHRAQCLLVWKQRKSVLPAQRPPIDNHILAASARPAEAAAPCIRQRLPHTQPGFHLKALFSCTHFETSPPLMSILLHILSDRQAEALAPSIHFETPRHHHPKKLKLFLLLLQRSIFVQRSPYIPPANHVETLHASWSCVDSKNNKKRWSLWPMLGIFQCPPLGLLLLPSQYKPNHHQPNYFHQKQQHSCLQQLISRKLLFPPMPLSCLELPL
mmetsp:Transcript_23952/g.39374  ORF Transcript_23952/g.39374 Transcript_23952/m.39374 type:complete len:275 (-) Transcript_23952:1926-2750(-)